MKVELDCIDEFVVELSRKKTSLAKYSIEYSRTNVDPHNFSLQKLKLLCSQFKKKITSDVNTFCIRFRELFTKSFYLDKICLNVFLLSLDSIDNVIKTEELLFEASDQLKSNGTHYFPKMLFGYLWFQSQNSL